MNTLRRRVVNLLSVIGSGLQRKIDFYFCMYTGGLGVCSIRTYMRPVGMVKDKDKDASNHLKVELLASHR